MRACTTIAANFIAYARVLADSFAEHHPGGTLTVLVIDDPGEKIGEGEPFEVLRPADIGVTAAAFDRTALLFDVRGLADFMSPFLLRHLVARDGECVLLDADSIVTGSLDEVAVLAREHGSVVTMHSLTPLEGADGHEAELLFLAAGVFNSGCMGFAATGRAFLDWWSDRVSRDWVSAPAGGYHFAQPYLTLGAALFGAHVLRDPGINVMGWNLQDRDVALVDGRWRVGDVALRQFHFVGVFDPQRPDALATRSATVSWPDLDERPGVQALCREYAEQLRAAGHAETFPDGYRYARLPGATPVDERIRWLYREALLQACHEEAPAPPLPYSGDDPGQFLGWLNEAPPDHHPYTPGVSRYLLAVRGERPDLVERFPDVPGAGNLAYLEWVRDSGAAANAIPTTLFEPALTAVVARAL
jgi:hypothetical protein